MSAKEIENIPIKDLIENGVERVVLSKGDRHARATKEAPTNEQVKFWKEVQRREQWELFKDFTEYLNSLPVVE